MWLNVMNKYNSAVGVWLLLKMIAWAIACVCYDAFRMKASPSSSVTIFLCRRLVPIHHQVMFARFRRLIYWTSPTKLVFVQAQRIPNHRGAYIGDDRPRRLPRQRACPVGFVQDNELVFISSKMDEIPQARHDSTSLPSSGTQCLLPSVLR